MSASHVNFRLLDFTEKENVRSLIQKAQALLEPGGFLLNLSILGQEAQPVEVVQTVKLLTRAPALPPTLLQIINSLSTRLLF